MQVVVNHLTRMRAPRICVAGIDLATREHVRPTTPPTYPITRTLLRANAGPLGVGAVVDPGPVTPTPNPPEVEDHRFVTTALRHVRDMPGEEYLEVLDDVACASLEAALGPALKAMPNDKWATEVGEGTASLAVLKPRGRIQLRTDFGKLRLKLSYPDDAANLSVTDIRFYEADQSSIEETVYNDVRARLSRGVETFLMLGLSRPFEGGADHEVHWLQVNGVCLLDRPVGDVP